MSLCVFNCLQKKFDAMPQESDWDQNEMIKEEDIELVFFVDSVNCIITYLNIYNSSTGSSVMQMPLRNVDHITFVFKFPLNGRKISFRFLFSSKSNVGHFRLLSIIKKYQELGIYWRSLYFLIVRREIGEKEGKKQQKKFFFFYRNLSETIAYRLTSRHNEALKRPYKRVKQKTLRKKFKTLHLFSSRRKKEKKRFYFIIFLRDSVKKNE